MSESARVAITTVLFILVTLDIVGNSLVCLIIKRNRDMRYAETEITSDETLSSRTKQKLRIKRGNKIVKMSDI